MIGLSGEITFTSVTMTLRLHSLLQGTMVKYVAEMFHLMQCKFDIGIVFVYLYGQSKSMKPDFKEEMQSLHIHTSN